MICRVCGNLMVRTGTCHTCPCCGETTGCGCTIDGLLKDPDALQLKMDRILFGVSVVDVATGRRVDPLSIRAA